MNRNQVEKSEEFFNVLGRSKSFHILHFLYGNDRRYSEIRKELNLNTGTLYRRLNDLKEYKLVTHTDNIYSITKKGERVVRIAEQILYISGNWSTNEILENLFEKNE